MKSGMKSGLEPAAIVLPRELSQESAAMRGADEATVGAATALETAAPRSGQSRPARIMAASAPAPAALTVAAIELPPRLSPLTRADVLAVAAAFSLHVLLFAAMVERSNRIGGGGSDLDAMGVEIVTIAPALESRSLDGVRERAMTGRVVGPADGSAPADSQAPTADRRQIEENRLDARPQAETAAAPADLIVPEWMATAPPEKAPASEPVIARAAGDGEQQQAALRSTTIEETKPDAAEARPMPQPLAQQPSSPADAMAAALPGGFDARGRDVIDGASAVMAAARAGRKDKYGGEVYAALRASVPRAVPGFAGKVTVEFAVAPTGAVQSPRIRATTGSRALEEAALAAVRSARFPRPPPELTASDLVYTMEYTFR